MSAVDDYPIISPDEAKQFVANLFPVQDPLLTAKEVAAMLRVNPRTVTNWVRSGKLTAIRVYGGPYRFRRVDIAKLLATRVEPSHE